MDQVTNAVSTIKEAGASSASTLGGFLSSTADSGVTAFKGTSLGESFFKNIGAIMVVVFILLGGILYIDLAAAEGGNKGVGASTPAQELVERKVYIEPNTGIGGGDARVLPTDVAWTAPLISMRNEMKEAFGTPYTESQLDKIQTTCSDSFCVMHNKSPAELERACNSITTKKMCGTKCCCGWAKYNGFEGDNDPTVVMNTAQANAEFANDGRGGKPAEAVVPGKCVSGNAKRPFDIKDGNNNDRDIDYYYYLGQCVGGRGCMKKGSVRA
jgi:hypothetical protein